AQFAAVEDWQPGISDLTVKLYATAPCLANGVACDVTGRYELAADGSYAKGALLNTYVTETWQRPGLNDDGNCVPRDVNGNRLAYPAGQQVTNSDIDCLEGPLMGVQFQAGFSAVDGNYGFGDGCFDGTLDATDPANPVCVGGTFTPLPGGRDYLVKVDIPTEAAVFGADAAHPLRPLYNVTREEDINIGNGDQFIPQVPPPLCAGALHIVDVKNVGTDGYGPLTLPDPSDNGGSSITVPASTPTLNPTFEDITSPFEGTAKPLCDTKLVPLNNGRSIVPTFNLYTDVQIPGRFWGLLVDDLNFSSNPQSLLYGEKAGVPFAPVGIYDWSNRLVTTVESDYNGLFDVLLPSTNRINCPTPSGVCANLYRFVGNDPGVPGQLNPNYRPEFRTIAAEFEAIPGLIVPADLAPTQVGVSIQIPGGQAQLVMCPVASTTPQLFTVSQPYVNSSGSFTIRGLGFGATGQVTLDGALVLPTTSWSDTQIGVTVPAGTAVGPHQLRITAANGESTINGLTFHVLGSATTPFPATAVLDNFNRGNSNNLGGNWNGISVGYQIRDNALRVYAGAALSLPLWATSFGANQEAYFTFTDVSTSSGLLGADTQGLILKRTSAPGIGNSNLIAVLYDYTNSSVLIYTQAGSLLTVTLQGTLSGVTFANGDRLGARALSNGAVEVYKNSTLIGSVNVTSGSTPWPTTLAQGGGQIGLRFTGTNGTGNAGPSAGDARIDNFGGGNVAASTGGSYTPHVYEV
ncbi:MAG: IPT/TIG domain-containing protein, partial [Caldilineaceae bacterium]|nr:IPT/TIG domain-containing protein [Caldilineaceae bacterium]